MESSERKPNQTRLRWWHFGRFARLLGYLDIKILTKLWVHRIRSMSRVNVASPHVLMNQILSSSHDSARLADSI
jgi:hypothetical protein